MHDPVQFQVSDSLRQHEEDVYFGAKGEAKFLQEHVLNEIGEEDIIGEQVILQSIFFGGDVILGDEQRIATLNLFEYILLMLDAILILPALDKRQPLLALDDHHLADHLLSSEALIINRSYYLVIVTRVHIPKMHFCEVDRSESSVVDEL